MLGATTMKIGDLVRYTPEGKLDERWSDWLGLVIKQIPGTEHFTIVRWNRDNSTTLSIRKKDLTVVNSV